MNRIQKTALAGFGIASMMLPMLASAAATIPVNGLTLDGQPNITVAPGSTVTAEVTFETTASTDVESMRRTILGSGLPARCIDIADVINDGTTWTRSFEMTPLSNLEGSYDIRIELFGAANNATNQNCAGTPIATRTFNDVLTVLEDTQPPVGTPPSPTPVPTPTPPPGFCPNVQGPLYKGVKHKNGEVAELQAFLIAEGYGNVITAGATGYFGDQTFRALKLFQLSENIPSTGYFGPLSQAEVNDCD